MKKITDRQQAIYLYIKDFILAHKFPPTIREIGEEFGIKSTNGVRDALNSLEKKGLIKKFSNCARGIELKQNVLQAPANAAYLPVIGSIAAGTPILAEENIEATLTIDKSVLPRSSEIFALRVQGDSIFDVKNLKEDMINWYTKIKQVKNHFAEFLWIMQNNMAVLDVWDYPYFMQGMKHKALHIFPQKNMIKNIGNLGRHINETCPLENMKTYKLDITNEPKKIKNNQKLQDELDISGRTFQKYPKISSIKNKKIYLWGTGEFVWKILFFIKKNKIKIKGFLDKQQKEEFYGCKVELPEQILNKKDKNTFIFIASVIYAKEMAKTCEQYGLKEGKDFWKPN